MWALQVLPTWTLNQINASYNPMIFLLLIVLKSLVEIIGTKDNPLLKTEIKASDRGLFLVLNTHCWSQIQTRWSKAIPENQAQLVWIVEM